MLNMLWTAEYSAEWEQKFRERFNLTRAGFNIHNRLKDWMTEDEVIEALKGQDIFFVGYDPITERVLENAPELKLILSVRDGPEENVDLAACKRHHAAFTAVLRGVAHLGQHLFDQCLGLGQVKAHLRVTVQRAPPFLQLRLQRLGGF